MKFSTQHIFTEEQVLAALQSIYLKAIHGIPKVDISVKELAHKYVKRYGTPKALAGIC